MDFILDAIDFIAENGLTLLPYYAYDQTTDLWNFQKNTIPRLTLENIANFKTNQKDKTPERLLNNTYFEDAKKIIKNCHNKVYDIQSQPFQTQYNDIRDFVLVQDIT